MQALLVASSKFLVTLFAVLCKIFNQLIESERKGLGINMAILTKEQIKEVHDITEKVVSVPEWNGEVKVRSITQRQMNMIKNRAKEEAGGSENVDEDSVNWHVFKEGMVEPQLTDEDKEWVLDKSSSAYMRIIKQILISSKLDDNALKQEEKDFRTE